VKNLSGENPKFACYNWNVSAIYLSSKRFSLPLSRSHLSEICFKINALLLVLVALTSDVY